MDTVSPLRGILIALTGMALAGAALAQATSQQSVPPQFDCGRSWYGAGPMLGSPINGDGYGPGMMRGYGMGSDVMMRGLWAGNLDLTDAQRTKINQIQDDMRRRHWALMGSLMDQQAKLRDLYDAPKRDASAIDNTYKAIDGVRQQMISASVDAHKRIEAVLTPKQLAQLRTYQSQQEQLGW